MFHYIIEPRAQKEYEESIDWYSKRSEQVALKLIEAIDNVITLICKQPYQAKNVYKNFHETSTKKYPFTVIYTIEEKIKTIAIISIYHHKLNPKKKYKK